MSIHRFLSSGDNNYFHSSAYGKVAQGERIGSIGMQTFGERYSVERNRKMVQRYHSSHIAQRSIGGSEPAAQTDSGQSRGSLGMPAGRQGQNLGLPQRPIVPPPRSAGFREPSSRGFNPFA